MPKKNVTVDTHKSSNDKENNKLDDTPRSGKKRRNSCSVEQTMTASKQEVSDILKSSLKWMNFGLAKKPETDDEVAEALNEFFHGMSETGELPSVEKMALALGTTRQNLWNWEHDERRPVRAAMIKQGKQLLAAMDAELVSRSKIPVVSYIFRSKNFYGMRDTQEIEVSSPTNLMGAPVDREEIAAKYSESVGELPTDIIDTESTEDE